MKLGGIILIIAGILAFGYHIVDINRMERVAKIGSLEIDVEKSDRNRIFAVPVVIGVVCVLTGSALLWSMKRK